MDEENMNTNSEAPMSENGMLAGKFKSVDALLHAYGELEAEFTRRSQRLKALEEELRAEPAEEKAEAIRVEITPVKEQAAKNEVPIAAKAVPAEGQNPSARIIPAEGAVAPTQAAHGQEELLRAVLTDEERARIACDYLKSLRGAPLLGGSGSSVVAPVKKPATIAEAGSFALGYLKSKK